MDRRPNAQSDFGPLFGWNEELDCRKELETVVIRSMRDAHRYGSSIRKSPFASVIPTGASQAAVPLTKSVARSGGIPRVCLPPCSRRELSPGCASDQRDAKERIYRYARHLICTYQHRAKMTGTIHGKNSLERHGQGWSLGISPLRAKDFCGGAKASWRSGRDDRTRGFEARMGPKG